MVISKPIKNDIRIKSNKKISKYINIIEYFFIVIFIIVLWQVLEVAEVIDPVTLPSPLQIAKTFLTMIQSGELLKHVWVSILRVFEGYALAVIFGILLGIAIGLSKRLNHVTDFLIQILKPIPPIAWIPLAILWFGIGQTSKIFLIFLGGFFPILINVTDGIQQTDKKLIEVAEVLETPKLTFITNVVIPSALPSIFTGLSVGIGSAWMCVVGAELIASDQGVGYMIMNARQFSQPDVVIIGMLTIGLIGKVIDVILKKAEKRLIKWNTKYQGTKR